MRRTVAALVLFACVAAADAWASQSESGCPAHWTGSGQATYYEAFDEPNACGLPLVPTDFVVAVGEAAFDGSAVCGRCLQISGPLGTVVATVTDYCVGPDCLDLDLSPNAFAAIGDPLLGILPVVWESVACEVTGPVAFHFHAHSNPYYAKIQLRNHRHGVAGLAVGPAGGDLVELERTSDNAFEYAPGVPIAASLSFRATDQHGSVLTETGLPYQPGVAVPGTTQFAFCPEPSALIGGGTALGSLGLHAARRRR